MKAEGAGRTRSTRHVAPTRLCYPCPPCPANSALFHRNPVPARWIDLSTDHHRAATSSQDGRRGSSLPIPRRLSAVVPRFVVSSPAPTHLIAADTFLPLRLLFRTPESQRTYVSSQRSSTSSSHRRSSQDRLFAPPLPPTSAASMHRQLRHLPSGFAKLPVELHRRIITLALSPPDLSMPMQGLHSKEGTVRDRSSFA